MKILTIGSGRDWKKYDDIYAPTSELMHVDAMYKYETSEGSSHMIGEDIIQYLENNNSLSYNIIHGQRIFEHIAVDKLQYLLYLLYCSAAPDATLHITVPDFEKVLETLKSLDPFSQTAIQFNKQLIQVSTELFNEPNDPHKSPWTKKLAKYYVELEDYWKVTSIKEVSLDGRDWYMQINAVKQNHNC